VPVQRNSLLDSQSVFEELTTGVRLFDPDSVLDGVFERNRTRWPSRYWFLNPETAEQLME
jgi:hypothetical protein